MKIISIVSSYRKNGNTNNVTKLIEEEIGIIAEKMNIPLEIEKVILGYYDIKLCRGCRVCFDKGEEQCPLKDDLSIIRDKMDAADGIILASPVCVEDINGIMKNWIDRMAFYCHRPAFAGKIAFLITTSGIGSSNHSIKTMKRALNTWGFYVSGQRSFRTGALMNISKIKELYNNKITKLSNKLFDDIVKNKAANPSFYSFIAFKVQQKYWQKVANGNNSIDYNYWDKQGWLNSKCKYYIKYNSSYIKVKSARVLGSIIAVFFT